VNKYEIQLTPIAKADIKTIKEYMGIVLNEPDIAAKLVKTLKDAVSSLSQMPERHPFVKDEFFTISDVRKLIVKSYAIFYQIEKNVVIVLRILHAKRNWQHLL